MNRIGLTPHNTYTSTIKIHGTLLAWYFIELDLETIP